MFIHSSREIEISVRCPFLRTAVQSPTELSAACMIKQKKNSATCEQRRCYSEPRSSLIFRAFQTVVTIIV